MKRSKHSLSHYNLLTADMGRMVVAGNYEVLPGDTIQHRTSALIRLAPQAAPVMHPVTARFHTFFCPYRLVMGTEFGDESNFEEFITGGKDGTNSATVPKITVDFATHGGEHTGSLLDYFGIPPDSDGLEVSALAFRAFWLTYEEYYADQDLVTVPRPGS